VRRGHASAAALLLIGLCASTAWLASGAGFEAFGDDAAPPGEPPAVPPATSPRVQQIGTFHIYADDGRLDVGAKLTTEVQGVWRPPYGPPNILPTWVPGILDTSRAVAAVVPAQRLEAVGTDAWRLLSETYENRLRREFGVGACRALQFAEQQVLGVGTAWLAAPDVVVTAGHVMTEFGSSPLRFVFDWRRSDDGRLPGPGSVISGAHVYAARSVLAGRFDGAGYDFAIVRLDRPVDATTGIRPLTLRRHGRLGADEPLYLLGYPRGLPLKYAGDARKVFEPVTWPQYGADLDAFRGNSGSPVLTGEGHEVVGMLVGGQSDHRVVGDPRCVEDVRSDTAGKGERVLRSIVLRRELQRLGVLPR
jgi:V8-like Glu-specific endopeptidase